MKQSVPPDLAAELDALTARLHRACLTALALPGDGPRGLYSTWPRYKLDWWDAEDWGSHRSSAAVTAGLIAPPRFTPSPAEIDDCLPALALLDGQPRLNRRVLALRAAQLWYGRHAGPDEPYAHWRGGWRAIGQMLAVSHKTARKAHWQAVCAAWAARHESPKRITTAA